jgi:uncharacterized membrane protein
MLMLTVTSFVLSAFFYTQLPEQMASHWDMYGNANGYMSKETSLFIVPAIMTLLTLGYFLIKPAKFFKDNVKESSIYADQFLIVLLLFFLYSQGIIIAWNLNYIFHFIYAFVPALGLMFIYLGFILPHIKRNFFIGIRTPWTLKDDTVWEKTHILGGQLFKVIGVLMLLSIFIPEYAFIVVVASVILMVPYCFFYSYRSYKNLDINKKKI